MPGIQFALQARAFGNQCTVFGREVVHQGIEALPEGGAVQAGGFQHFTFDEAIQRDGYLEAMAGDAVCHDVAFSTKQIHSSAAAQRAALRFLVAPLVPTEGAQGKWLETLVHQRFRAAQVRQVDDRSRQNGASLKALQQAYCRLHGAAGGDQIVH